jgi:uncharacterized tellurite resistance protein B-like protein
MKERFSTAEWDELRSLPFVLFALVADVDGEIQEEERRRLADALRSPAEIQEELHRELLEDVLALDRAADEFEQMRRITYGKDSIEVACQRAKEILSRRLTTQEYNNFFASIAVFMLDVARSVAWPGEPSVSDEERLAMRAVGELFEVNLADGSARPGDR